jgi:hypothetical protein
MKPPLNESENSVWRFLAAAPQQTIPPSGVAFGLTEAAIVLFDNN